MSWAEIKKAINSNITKTLDNLITEKTSDELSKINSISSIVTVAGNIKAVKSVQRGTFNVIRYGVTNITISSINPVKSMVLLSGNAIGIQESCVQPYPYSLTDTVLSIAIESTDASIKNQIISWQVIEFY